MAPPPSPLALPTSSRAAFLGIFLVNHYVGDDGVDDDDIEVLPVSCKVD